ncbi:hypothetical protein CMI37_16950 [Candidatus Pacearchaeota archaeon]|nr:hypothetical protein [Candidatus Pacearchaeota archaeon]|tara:strand:+ start:727 stop:2616 length:1890 start_codon:yes stop_codon:yes gene_type:complete
MGNVYRKREVSLTVSGTDYRIPLVGQVTRFNAAQFGQKQVFGDVSKDDELLTSTYVPIADQTGGIGVYDAEEGVHDDRSFFSTAELGVKGHLLLPPLVTTTTNPGVTEPGIGVEYNNLMYWAYADKVHSWSEGSTTWGSSIKTLTANPTDVIVHKDKKYWACETDFDRYDGSAWTDGATLGTAQPCRYFTEWDGKLFSLDNDGQLDYTIDEGETWITSAKSDLPPGSFTSLFVYRDLSGNFIIHLGTKIGLFTLNFDSALWIETDLEMPFHDVAARGSDRWYDAAYVPNGGSITRYKAPGSLEMTPVGPDLDYGLPGKYRGNIIKVIPGQSHLFALIDATSALAKTTYLASYNHAYGNVSIHDKLGFSAVLKSDSLGDRIGRWSVVYLSGSTARPARDAVITTADGQYRLWFAADDRVQYISLKLTKTNPLEDADHEYALTGVHETSWFDANRASVSKVGARVNGHMSDTSSTEYVKIYYGTDYDDDTYTLLTSTTFSDGQVDADGDFEFQFASFAGIAFSAIRFKVEHYRGTSSTKVSPDLHWLRLSYMKVLEPRPGFRARLDCTRDYRMRTAETLLSTLEIAEGTKSLMAFQFNDSDTHYVRLLSREGQETHGREQEGIFDAVFVAP